MDMSEGPKKEPELPPKPTPPSAEELGMRIQLLVEQRNDALNQLVINRAADQLKINSAAARIAELEARQTELELQLANPPRDSN